jgi:peptide deformylase
VASIMASSTQSATTQGSPDSSPFRYSENWTGTRLSLEDLQTAAQPTVASTKAPLVWKMGRWPDPLLRRQADPVDAQWFGTATLKAACDALARTARVNRAVGLAAQQCGVNARIVFLDLLPNNVVSSSSVAMINPRIIQRSPETAVRVWQEHCLVLPPTFVATVLRDAWVVIEYQEASSGEWRRLRLYGKAARAALHELDHDRGILVTDHVGLEEMENDIMRQIERPGHSERMILAYGRY